MSLTETKPTIKNGGKVRKLTPEEIAARLAAHKPSWVPLLAHKLNKLWFPALVKLPPHPVTDSEIRRLAWKFAGKPGELRKKLERRGCKFLPPGKELAGDLAIMRHDTQDERRRAELLAKAKTLGPVALDEATKALDPKKGEEAAERLRNEGIAEAMVKEIKGFMPDFRRASEYKIAWRIADTYFWMLTHYRQVEQCKTKADIWRLVKEEQNTAYPGDQPSFYRLLRKVGLPVSK